ncbi:MAG: hypothetical protein U5L04_01650 [Trueperaceae bacterium]|nr:hypothetical protein [Trueperaceae bacterium]
MRTLSDIADELLALAHRTWSSTADARATMKGLAAVILDVEQTGDTMHDQTARQTANGPYIDLIGREAGKERLPFETVAQWRARAILSPMGTVAWLRERIQHEMDALGYEGYKVEVFQPRNTRQFADTSTSVVDDNDTRQWPRHAVVSIPPMYAPELTGRAFAGHGFADVNFAQETTDSHDRYIHRRIEKAVALARQAGTVVTIIYRRDRGVNASLVEFVAHFAQMEVGLV